MMNAIHDARKKSIHAQMCTQARWHDLRFSEMQVLVFAFLRNASRVTRDKTTTTRISSL